jgi:hypothetical protein
MPTGGIQQTTAAVIVEAEHLRVGDFLEGTFAYHARPSNKQVEAREIGTIVKSVHETAGGDIAVGFRYKNADVVIVLPRWANVRTRRVGDFK